MELQLSKCLIRPWRKGDEASLVQHADNYQVWRNLRDRFPHPYTLAHAREWIKFANAQQPLTDYAIVIDGEASGGIGLVIGADIHRRTAEIGYWLGESCWGRGVATEAVQAVTAWAFANLELERIFAAVFDRNIGSARVLEKAGFQFEARLRKAAIKEGQVLDELQYALVRERLSVSQP